MPEAREWADEFEEGIKALGFSEEQIHRHKDPDRGTMDAALVAAGNKIRQNAQAGRRTFLLFFYAGRGFSENG